MDIINQLMLGFSQALLPFNILMAFLGGAMGVIVGALPGLGSVAGVALLLPLTFKMDPTAAIIMLAGIYYGNMFGGSISAILINIPGDSPCVMTALDGNQLAKKGRAGHALFMAFTASFFGGLLGIVTLTVVGPALASLGLKFGPAEFTALILMALTSIGWLLGDNPIKGVISAAVGLLIATIGTDLIEGMTRFTFGSANLASGVSFIPMVIGLFGLSQVMLMIARPNEFPIDKVPKVSLRNSIPPVGEYLRGLWTSLRSGVLGFYIGLLPGSGATTAAFLSYIAEKRLNKHPERLGKGALEGVAASEAANNAASIGSFAPLLSLGIPGSGTSALLLGGLMMFGLMPGPLLFSEAPEFVWGLIASMYVGNFLVALTCILAIPLFVYILKIPRAVMAPVIVSICILGSYSVNNNMFDLWVMLFFGFIGYFMNRFQFPIPALILSVVLGPRLMTSMRQAFMISHGEIGIFFTSTISLTLIIITVALIAFPTLNAFLKKRKAAASE
ncbi:tripartite tricarboxylate transporter permease [Desulfoscipio sp. XC116]|uniref:tripartite tricarboxylate transporter permease n=1 Tax=Desulfoscipio sp. XC116 TaxID=3144975 RepID=UPI00325B1A23